MKEIDDIKLQYLKNEIRNREIVVPSRQDISMILQVGYKQAGLYLKELKLCRKQE